MDVVLNNTMLLGPGFDSQPLCVQPIAYLLPFTQTTKTPLIQVLRLNTLTGTWPQPEVSYIPILYSN
jgi:hypothetical protein